MWLLSHFTLFPCANAVLSNPTSAHSLHPTEATHRAAVQKADKLLVQDPLKDLFRWICYQLSPSASLAAVCLTAAPGRLMDEEWILTPQMPYFSQHIFVSRAGSWECSGAAEARKLGPQLKYWNCGLSTAPGENSQLQ